MVVTLAGIVMLFISLQLINAHFSSFVVPSLSITEVIFVPNTAPGIVLTVPGISMLVFAAGTATSDVFAAL